MYQHEVLGSFSNDDGDGKSNRFIKQNNNFARESPFLYISLPLAGRQRRENAYFHVLWRMQTNHDEFFFL